MQVYTYLYVLAYEDMSTHNFTQLREALADSKFLMGKNKVFGIGFGTE